jgi:hypothetical protein
LDQIPPLVSAEAGQYNLAVNYFYNTLRTDLSKILLAIEDDDVRNQVAKECSSSNSFSKRLGRLGRSTNTNSASDLTPISPGRSDNEQSILTYMLRNLVEDRRRAQIELKSTL